MNLEQLVKQAVDKHCGGNPWKYGRRHIAGILTEKTGNIVSHSSIRRHLDKLRENWPTPAKVAVDRATREVKAPGHKVTPIPEYSSEVGENTWTLSMPRTEIHTLDALLKKFEVDLSVWRVKSFVVNSWETSASDGSGNIITKPLYQVKAVLERANGMTVEAAKEEIEALKAEAKAKMQPPPCVRAVSGGSQYKALEISAYDAHFGRLSWGAETGGADYDLGIAARDYNAVIDGLLAKSPYAYYDRICYVVGNDLIHFDNLNATTTKGTPLDVDSRFPKVFAKVRQTVREQIEKFRQIAASVEVIVIPGNHDTLSAWHLGDSLECLYENCEQVHVDNTPRLRKYWHYGDNLVMFTHGDKGKHVHYPLIMANETPSAWATSRFREVHLGHFHHLETKEIIGCRIRVIPAVCPADYWHASNGYVGALRAAQAFVWDSVDGLEYVIEENIKDE